MSTNAHSTTTPFIEETIAIGGMHCGRCVAAVREALGATPGVAVTDVAVGKARLLRDPERAGRAAVEAAVEAAGYTLER